MSVTDFPAGFVGRCHSLRLIQGRQLRGGVCAWILNPTQRELGRQVARAFGRHRRLADREVDQIGHIAAAGLVAGDDNPRKSVSAALAELTAGVGIGNRVRPRRTAAEHRIDLAAGKDRLVAIASDSDDIVEKAAVFDPWDRDHSACIAEQRPKRRPGVGVHDRASARTIGDALCRRRQGRETGKVVDARRDDVAVQVELRGGRCCDCGAGQSSEADEGQRGNRVELATDEH